MTYGINVSLHIGGDSFSIVDVLCEAGIGANGALPVDTAEICKFAIFAQRNKNENNVIYGCTVCSTAARFHFRRHSRRSRYGLFGADFMMPLDALTISKADFGMMRDVLERECSVRGQTTSGVERKRLARLIMYAYRDGMVSEAELTALVRREADHSQMLPTGRYLKDFPSSR